MSSYTYKQESKNQVRHTVIRNAVELLTNGRSEACCVRNSYVRDLYDYFLSLAESHEQTEAEKIEQEYIREWEHIHSNLIGYKRPDELSVCYLSGPEPENDFNELVDMGVLPQNIWAFENKRNTYLQALGSVDCSSFMQPKIVKTSIERFFENSPKKFDIVYIDACASLISDQHALRCVASLFQNHRLNSPGILITNFAYLDATNAAEIAQYTDLISRYNILQHNRAANLINESGTIHFKYDGTDINRQVEQNLEDAYGEFVTAMVCNAASITVPSLRFCNSTYLQSISSNNPTTNDHLSYLERKDQTKPGEYLNIFVRNQRINARFSTKGNITTRLGEISSINDPVFGEALKDVKSFIEKLQVLCGDEFQDFNKMLGHSRKNTQSRTNQNFYLLWIALAHIDYARVKQDKAEIFEKIRNLFLLSQDINDDEFDVKGFIQSLSSI